MINSLSKTDDFIKNIKFVVGLQLLACCRPAQILVMRLRPRKCRFVVPLPRSLLYVSLGRFYEIILAAGAADFSPTRHPLILVICSCHLSQVSSAAVRQIFRPPSTLLCQLFVVVLFNL